MADQTVNGDAVQTLENTFSIDGAQSSVVNIPENLSVADADFTFEGGDLVMSFPDGTTITVEGYQDNPNPPNLVSSDGAEVGSDVVSAMAGPADGGAPAGGGDFGFMPTEEAEAIQAQEVSGNVADNPNVISGTDGEPIGNIESLEGEVFAIRADGERVRLELGDQVFQGDILESGDDGKVDVLLADETTFAVGSEGRMILDEMVYDPATQEGSVSMSVLQGVFTFVSGQVVYVSRQWMTIAQCLSGEQTMASVPALDELATAAGGGDGIVHQFEVPDTRILKETALGSLDSEVASLSINRVSVDVSTRCVAGDTIFTVKNTGAKRSKTGTLAICRIDGPNRQMIRGRSFILEPGEVRKFKISEQQNLTGELGISVQPSWYKRPFTLDGGASCK